MKNRKRKRLFRLPSLVSMAQVYKLILLLSLLSVFSIETVLAGPPAPPDPVETTGGIEKIAPEVQAALRALPAGEMLSVIVTLKERADLNSLTIQAAPSRSDRVRNVVTTLRTTADQGQRAIKGLLAIRQAEGKVNQITYFWIFNGLALTATPDLILELASRPDVIRITANETFQAPPLPPAAPGEIGILANEPNLSLINVPSLWNMGFRGEGVVVANMDTGVDVNHIQLGPRWRGGLNSWFDPYGQNPTPVDQANQPGPGDNSGHGTQSMGIMVGGEHNGVAFGIAPEAKWIAVKIFNNLGAAQALKIHEGFQWLLDPDNNPATADAPHVVNGSWTYGNVNSCNLEYQADLQALRAAGILPIFSAGNGGPNSSTSYSPANYPEALAVGAINNTNLIYSLSSRGPRAVSPPGCANGTVFPDVVAPGVSIHTTHLVGIGYSNATGTSFAAPHVAGILALLLDAGPNLTVAQQEAALINTVVDLGAVGPDDSYGRGRVNALGAFQSIFDNQTYLPVMMK